GTGSPGCQPNTSCLAGSENPRVANLVVGLNRESARITPLACSISATVSGSSGCCCAANGAIVTRSNDSDGRVRISVTPFDEKGTGSQDILADRSALRLVVPAGVPVRGRGELIQPGDEISGVVG